MLPSVNEDTNLGIQISPHAQEITKITRAEYKKRKAFNIGIKGLQTQDPSITWGKPRRHIRNKTTN